MATLPFTLRVDEVARASIFAGLPDLPAIRELRRHRQWVGWHYVERDGKPTKPPLNPHTGFGASHSNPSTWGTFGEASRLAERRKLPGIGFVLAPNDDFSGIDLDDCRDPETGEIEFWAQKIIRFGETYAEVSPSGAGLRLILRGKIDKTVKCDPASVEAYRDKRYLTITGQHLAGTPETINPAPRTMAALLARVEQFRPTEGPAPVAPSPAQNRASRLDAKPSSGGQDRFWRAVNDAAMRDLGRWVPSLFPRARFQPGTGAYRVASKDLGRRLQEDLSIAPGGIVDFGVHDMGDARAGKRTPIDLAIEHGGHADAKAAALWLCDQLGVRPQALGWEDEEEKTARGAAIARRLIENAAGDLIDDETGEIVHEKRGRSVAAFPDDLTRVPGLVGGIVDWIEATARRPSRVLALGAAMTLVGTALGRRLSGPTMSGTHLYVLCLTPTGAGKDHGLQQVRRVLYASKMGHHIGPDEFMSMPALINFMVRQPLALCPMDEFGGFLRRVNGRRASGFEQGITKTLRTAWGVNFGSMSTPEWAGRAKQDIHAPAISIYAVSTPGEFYNAIEGSDIVNGFLNRFLCLSVEERADEVDPSMPPMTVPDWISEPMMQLYTSDNPLLDAQRNRSDAKVDPTVLPWQDDKAQAVYRLMLDEVQALTDRRAEIEPFMVRTGEMALRLATVRAAGINPDKPTLSKPDMEWGRDVAMWSARAMIAGAGEHMAETEIQGEAKRIVRMIRENGGRITRRDLLQRLKHRLKGRDFDNLMSDMISAETLRTEVSSPKGGGPMSRWYMLAD